ncbi:unnamed protein product [Discula destructiva]
MGDAIFDRFFASGVQMIAGQELQKSASQAALAALIARPVILVSHSNEAGSAHLASDIRPRQVKAIVSVEAKGPPFTKSSLLSSTGNQYGVCQAPLNCVTRQSRTPKWT